MKNSTSVSSIAWQRSLNHYPAGIQRIWYLALAVAATVALYHQYYVLPSVLPLVIKNLGLSLPAFGLLNVAISLLGAISAIFAGLSDRLGRANLVVYGVLVSSLITLGISFSTNVTAFIIMDLLLGFEEGIILSTTPALIRDFSPRLGRALAMAFWSTGPIVGNLFAQFIASRTLSGSASWQSQYVIAAIVGLIVSVICFFGMRDLSASLRGQIMMSLREKELLEARARNLNVEEALKNPWRQILRPRLLICVIGNSLSLVLLFAIVLYFPTYLNSVFKFPLAEANGLVSLFTIIGLVFALGSGYISDRLLVRKPILLASAILAVIVTIFFISRTGQPASTSAGLMAVIIALFGAALGVLNPIWAAAYSETVEDINPSLVGTGFALYGSVTRFVSVASTLALTAVVGNGQGFIAWWWVCTACMVVFIPTIFVFSGHWNSAQAWAAVRTREQAEGLDVGTSIEAI